MNLLNDSVILAPRELFDVYLSQRREHPELAFHLLTMEDAEALFAYQADERALIALLKQGLSYELAQKELAALCRIDQRKRYKSARLEALKPLQKELVDEGLLFPTPFPERTFLGKNVVVAGYQDGMRIARLLGELPNMAISFDKAPSPSEPIKKEVYVFKDIYDELHDVFNRIAHDLEMKTPIEKIFLLGADASYESLLEDFSKRYGFTVAKETSTRLFDTGIYQNFRLLFPSYPLEEALSRLENAFPEDPDFAEIYRFGKGFAGIFSDPFRQRELYDEIAKSKPASLPSYGNVVRRMHSFFAPEGSHVYVLNFAMGAFPSIVPESDYLSDEECKELSLPTSEEQTQEAAAELNALLASGMVCSLSYKERAFGQNFYPSGLIQRNGYTLSHSPRLPYEYSSCRGRFVETALRDEYENYLHVDPSLEELKKATPLPEYRSYDNTFKPFSFTVSNKKERCYSPTSLERFSGCPFSYYMSYLLKAEEKETNFGARLGIVFHGVMERYGKEKAFSFERAWAEAMAEEIEQEGAFSSKEEVLFLRLHDECAKAVAFYQNLDQGIAQAKPTWRNEDFFRLPLAEDPSVVMNGQFDKIVEFGDPKRYYYILDYKTNETRFSPLKFTYGLSAQLPFYAYYASQAKDYAGATLVGLFIGPLLSGGQYKSANETLAEFDQAKFKLDGLALKDPEALRQLTPQWGDGWNPFLAGLALGQNGFYTNCAARLKQEEEFREMGAKAAGFVLVADRRIQAGDLAISPAKLGQYSACTYCSFLDVCFRKEKDIRYLEKAPSDDDEEVEEENDGLE